MKIALIGYGKMGKVIEGIALERGHTISAIIDVQNSDDLEKLNKENTDVAIEFSSPHAAFDNLSKCMSGGLRVVSGTTGWLDKRSAIEKACVANKGAFFYASNYSIGVNIFFQLNKQLAKLMNPHQQYEINSLEIHHNEKLDSPSGTAITLAEGIIENNDQKDSFVNQAIPKTNEVPIWSIREGKVPGTHSIKYISDVDEIEIKHEAKSRYGFALGAVIAAEWLNGKEGIYGMDEMLGFTA
ncbi:dihydrodipicolinate reductase [Spirosomataceae bacterium TFI 002]|nr:dihydrodipicolinate reductase [Spirosomataceae bacterium TFI 002]